jgi:ABC-type Mn2+/Zn2+ transport system permease subunit
MKGSPPVEENVLPVPAPPAGAPPSSRRHDSGSILALVNGVLTGVGGVYISTRSGLITVVAALTAIALTAIVIRLRR